VEDARPPPPPASPTLEPIASTPGDDATAACEGPSSGAAHPPRPQPPGAATTQPKSRLMQDRSLVLIEDILDDDDASVPSSPRRPTSASGLDIFLVHPSAPSASSSLSPFFSPFHPGDGSMGRSKAHRWADEDLDDLDAERSPVSSPSSYLDVVCLGSQLRTSPLLERAKPCLIVGGSRGSAATERGKRPLAEGAQSANVVGSASFTASGVGVVHGQCNHRARRPRPHPQLVHGLPTRPMEGRVPARQCLGRCGQGSAHQRISAPDANGWREVLSRGSVSGAGGARPARRASANQRPPTRYPADLHQKCFNCLSIVHRVVNSKLPSHCLRCRGFRHLARDCKRWQAVPPSSSVKAQVWFW
jgi:hypothetical protein